MCTSDVSTPGCKLSMIVLRNGKQVVIILNFIPISVIMIVLKLSYVWSDDKDVDAMYRSRNMVSGVVLQSFQSSSNTYSGTVLQQFCGENTHGQYFLLSRHLQMPHNIHGCQG